MFSRERDDFFQENSTFFNFYIHHLPFFLLFELSTSFYCHDAVLNIKQHLLQGSPYYLGTRVDSPKVLRYRSRGITLNINEKLRAFKG